MGSCPARFVTLCLILVVSSWGAQKEALSVLRGTAVDMGRDVIPGAEVTLKNDITGVEVKARTDERGRFEVILSPGTYSAIFTVPVVWPTLVSGIAVEANSAAVLEVRIGCARAVIAFLDEKPINGRLIPPQSQPEPYDDTEAYKVYETLLPVEWAWRVAHAKRLVIRKETESYCMCLKPEGNSKELMDPAIADYLRKVQTTWTLQPNLSVEKPLDFVPTRELKSPALAEDYWQEFNRKHPDSGGWTEFSPVGFNQDKTIAIVYVGHHCGWVCGGGDFHVLQKTGGKWVPLQWAGRKCQWLS